MARILSANFPRSMAVGYREVYTSELKAIPKEFRQVFNVIRGKNPGGESGSSYLDQFEISGLGTFAPKPEGDPIAYDVPRERGTIRATPYTFGLATRITKEAREDGRYQVFDKLAKFLARSGMHAMEVQAFRLLNNGAGTTGGTGHTAAGYDNLALFSTAHTLGNGSTAANRLTTDVDLSLTGLELMFDLLEGTVDDNGLPIPSRPKLLVVPYQSRWVAKELADSELKPYTSNNEINPVKGEFQWMAVHYLTDSDSWFVLGEDADLNVWIREDPTFETGEDFDTGDYKMKSTFRMASFHGGWRHVVGSYGA